MYQNPHMYQPNLPNYSNPHNYGQIPSQPYPTFCSGNQTNIISHSNTSVIPQQIHPPQFQPQNLLASSATNPPQPVPSQPSKPGPSNLTPCPSAKLPELTQQSDTSNAPAPSESNPTPVPLMPHPEQIFDTVEELIAFANKWALEHGFAVSTKNSHKDRDIYLKCDLGGQNVQKSDTSSSRSSRRIEYPYLLYGRILKRKVPHQWHLSVKNSEHNHEPTEDIQGHVMHRRMGGENHDKVASMLLAGIAPRQILTSLKQEDPNFLSNSQDIYNFKKKIAKQTKQGKSSMEYVLEYLSTSREDYISNKLISSDGNLVALFFAHPQSVRLARKYNNLCLLDCTYKTNSYNFPLLHIVGMACTGQQFSIAFCLMRKETQDYYSWALQQLHLIWDHQDMPKVFITDREMALVNPIEEETS